MSFCFAIYSLLGKPPCQDRKGSRISLLQPPPLRPPQHRHHSSNSPQCSRIITCSSTWLTCASKPTVPLLELLVLSTLYLMTSILFRAVLPKVQLSMFEKWVYTFGRELIMLSSALPLVSGFHKLLGICFSICKEIQYFKVTGNTCDDPFLCKYLW